MSGALVVLLVVVAVPTVLSMLIARRNRADSGMGWPWEGEHRARRGYTAYHDAGYLGGVIGFDGGGHGGGYCAVGGFGSDCGGGVGGDCGSGF